MKTLVTEDICKYVSLSSGQVTYIRTTQEVFDDSFGITFARIPESFNEAKIKLVEYFNWTRVAVVYDFSTGAGRYVKVCFVVVWCPFDNLKSPQQNT